MVAQKYRWDFIGLSTDTKPTSETSEKVVNGSTYYCSDTSKLYVYCDGTWYERKPLGGGGGGGTSDFNDLSNRPKYNGSDMTGSTNIPEVKTYTAGSNVAISDQNVISATDTTYSAFTGTDGTAAGTAGLVPAPATTDAGKFLGASGLWEAVQAGGGVKELTSTDYNYPAANPDGVAMWKLTTGFYSVATGTKIYVTASNNSTSSYSGLFLLHSNGYQCSYLMIKGANDLMRYWDVNIGAGTVREQFYIAQTVDNLTSSSEYSPLSANQGKVLKNLVDSLAIRASGTPTTSTVGSVGTLYEDTTNGKLYICTDTTGGTYTWEEVGAGGGGPTVVQTTGTSTTDVMSQNAVTSMVFADPSATIKVQIGSEARAGGSSGNASVAIGNSAKAYQNGGDGSNPIYPTAVGPEAVAKGNRSLALGANSSAAYTGSVAVGAGANATSVGQFDIGTRYTSYGYNNSNYRLLTGLYDPQSAHDAATKGYVDAITLTNAGAPTTATVGTVGQLLEDTTNGKLYICTDTTGGTYTWEEVGAGGGGGPTVVQTTGTSTTDVMSQNAVTSMVYADPESNTKVRIGAGADNVGQIDSVSIGRNANNGVGIGKSYVVGIGSSAKAKAEAAVAIGMASSANGVGSIALGARSQATSQGEMNIGTTQTSYGYNSSNYRLLTGLYDGQSAHDAATVAQGNTLSTSAPTTSTVGVLGQLYTDTTNMHTYQCTAISGDTYTWTQRW